MVMPLNVEIHIGQHMTPEEIRRLLAVCGVTDKKTINAYAHPEQLNFIGAKESSADLQALLDGFWFMPSADIAGGGDPHDWRSNGALLVRPNHDDLTFRLGRHDLLEIAYAPDGYMTIPDALASALGLKDATLSVIVQAECDRCGVDTFF